MITVISLGGSIVAPGGVDEEFLFRFVSLIREFLQEDQERRFILVSGGGGPARAWQNAYRNVTERLQGALSAQEADWIGVMATRLNARLVKALLGGYCSEDVVIDPSQVAAFTGRVLVAAGWKPGFSTDYDAVLLAERFGAAQVINLSNIAKVYTDDPNRNPDAKPLDRVSWDGFRAMIGEEWSPGKNVPFDPVASRQAAKAGIQVLCAAGRDIPNLRNILSGRPFTGTLIG